MQSRGGCSLLPCSWSLSPPTPCSHHQAEMTQWSGNLRSTSFLCLTGVLGIPAMPDSSSAMHQKGKTFVFEHTLLLPFMHLSCTQKKKKKDHLLKKAAEAKPDNSYLYAYSDKICTHFWYTLVANTKERILGSTQEFPSQARLCSSGTADVLLFNMRKCRILFVFLLEII